MKSSKGLVLVIAAISLLCSAAASFAEAKDAQKAEAKSYVVIGKDMKIKDCGERGIDEYVIFIYSKYCPHCKKAMPIVEGIVAEQKIGSKYLPIDTVTKEGRDLLDELGIKVQYVPVLIKDCKAYVGGKKRELYEKVLKGN